MLLLLGIPAQAAPPPPVTLANGMTVIARERRVTPLVAVDLWIRAGAREEGQQEAGCAHFLEHLLFKGTRSRGPGAIDAAIESLGATLHAATVADGVHLSTTVAADRLTEALRILSDVARNATLPAEEIERERGVILDELAQHRTDGEARLRDRLYHAAYSGHPYQRSPGGDPAAIAALKRETLAAFYARCYRPERAILALAGAVSPQQALAASEAAFGSWAAPNRSAAHPAGIGAAEEGAARILFQRIREEGRDPRVGIAVPVPPARDARMACASQVAAALLEERSHSARTGSGALRGLKTSVDLTPRRDISLLIFQAALPQPAPADSPAEAQATALAVETALRQSLHSLQSAPPSPAEFQAAKNRVLGLALVEQETNAGLARALGYAALVGGDAPEAFRARLMALTPADVQRYLRDYVQPERYVALHLLPAAALPR